jgi:hypothetical protein
VGWDLRDRPFRIGFDEVSQKRKNGVEHLIGWVFKMNWEGGRLGWPGTYKHTEFRTRFGWTF